MRVGTIVRAAEPGNARVRVLRFAAGCYALLLEEFYDNGKPKSVEPSMWGSGRWDDDGMQRHGSVKRWWENGKLAAEETYKNGQLDGPSTSYFEDGPLESSETFKDGRVTSRKQYDPHGKLLKDERYNEDGSRQ